LQPLLVDPERLISLLGTVPCTGNPQQYRNQNADIAW
jgi:hypothetical protein